MSCQSHRAAAAATTLRRLATTGQGPRRKYARTGPPPVLTVLYLIFNEGYTATSGQLVRTDLCAEGIRLSRALAALMPDEPEVTGLLTLLPLTQARGPARTSPTGELVPLPDQDRSRWDQALIGEGHDLAAAA